MSEKQTLILIISRFQLDVTLIPPLKIIIPMLENLYPVRVFTSVDNQIKSTKNTSIYQQLVKKLETYSNYCRINQIILQIMNQYDKKNSNNYRLCILGYDKVDWGVVMQLKRRKVVIDTVCGESLKENQLVQISYVTQGIHKKITEKLMIKTFQTEIGMNSKMRHHFRQQKTQKVQFSLKCFHCPSQINSSFFACSICLAVYCHKHQQIKQCVNCNYMFD